MADTIKIGNLDISSFKVGGDDCSIYLGDILLYPTVKYKYQAKYTDGSEYNIECDTATGLTSADTRVSSYTDVSAVTVGDCIITLKTNAFSGFTSLESVSLPNSLVNINQAAFMGCTSLVSLNIPNGVTYLGNLVFANCTSLTTVNIPSGVTTIPLRCFINCYSLTSIEIPSGVTRINSSAFQNCSGLTEVVIPSSVAGINFAAFANCSGLTSIKMESATPPTLPKPSTSFAQPFDNTNDCPIYVPAESVNTYKTATNWTEYADRIQAIPTLQWVEFTAGDTIPKGNIYGFKAHSQIAGDYSSNILEIGTDSNNCVTFGHGAPKRAPDYTAYFYLVSNGTASYIDSWMGETKTFIFSDYASNGVEEYYYEDGTKTMPFDCQLYIYA